MGSNIPSILTCLKHVRIQTQEAEDFIYAEGSKGHDTHFWENKSTLDPIYSMGPQLAEETAGQ